MELQGSADLEQAGLQRPCEAFWFLCMQVLERVPARACLGLPPVPCPVVDGWSSFIPLISPMLPHMHTHSLSKYVSGQTVWTA